MKVIEVPVVNAPEREMVTLPAALARLSPGDSSVRDAFLIEPLQAA